MENTDLEIELTNTASYTSEIWGQAQKRWDEAQAEMRRRVRTRTLIDEAILLEYVKAKELVLFIENENMDYERRLRELKKQK